MKKIFAMLLCVIVAASSMSVSAKKWRIFTDASVGWFNNTCYDDNMVYGVRLSGGYQYKTIFFGGGTNIMMAAEDLYIPLFAQIRKDFFRSNPKAVSFWMSVKLGYYLPGVGDAVYFDYSCGIRKMLKDNLGLNIGLSCMNVPMLDLYDTKEHVGGVTLNIGLDF